MISICTNWKDRNGSATLHQVEIEVLHLLTIQFAEKEMVCSETLIDIAKEQPVVYPILASMETRRALWHITNILKRFGFERENVHSKYWMKV